MLENEKNNFKKLEDILEILKGGVQKGPDTCIYLFSLLLIIKRM